MAVTSFGEIAESLRRSTVLIQAGPRGNGSGVIWSSGGIIVTTSATNSGSVLTFGAGNVPSWMAKGLNVYDNSTPGAIAQGHKVKDFDTNTVTLTTPVDATVNSGDTIVFSPPPLVGSILIDSPWMPPPGPLKRRGLGAARE